MSHTPRRTTVWRAVAGAVLGAVGLAAVGLLFVVTGPAPDIGAAAPTPAPNPTTQDPPSAQDPPPAQDPPDLVVSEVAELDPSGHTVTVTGRDFDPARGVYVAFCVVPPAGSTPTPCGGGVDLTGESAASVWISSDPPDYADGLTRPYGPDGSFQVELTVSAMLTPTIDCRAVQCAVVTRNDHTRLSDRSQDVIVPIWFRGDDTLEPADDAEPERVVEHAHDQRPGDDEERPAPRGAAPTWPVWAVSGVVALGLVVAQPRRPRLTSRRLSTRGRSTDGPPDPSSPTPRGATRDHRTT